MTVQTNSPLTPSVLKDLSRSTREGANLFLGLCDASMSAKGKVKLVISVYSLQGQLMHFVTDAMTNKDSKVNESLTKYLLSQRVVQQLHRVSMALCSKLEHDPIPSTAGFRVR